MASYKEIVTKAVIGKAKKTNEMHFSFTPDENVDTVLGCWVINHNFNGVKNGDSIIITGSYDVNIWYSYDNDTKTEVIRETNNYKEKVNMRPVDEDVLSEEIIVRSLKQPNCVKVNIDGENIDYSIEKELGIELVGDVKVKIEASLEEDPWEDIVEEARVDNVIDKEVKEDYLEEKI